MAMAQYLAVTAAEFHNISALPSKIAWMACHFSPYSTGIINLPAYLPENSMLILNDITPVHNHDPDLITHQISQCAEKNHCMGILLDFQHPDNPELNRLTQHLLDTLSIPVASPNSSSGPVFVPMIPCNIPLSQHLNPWKGRELWLEISTSPLLLRITPEGCQESPLKIEDIPYGGIREESLHCHYIIEEKAKEIRFTLWRTKEDIDALLEEAGKFGVTNAIGLWQELR